LMLLSKRSQSSRRSTGRDLWGGGILLVKRVLGWVVKGGWVVNDE
jgi:hypothetical protein